jgi:FixJ family two-component response regulator
MANSRRDPVVLVIEEDEQIRESLSDMLTERGYAAVAVGTAKRGLALLEQGFRPRVILLDPYTPNGAGKFKSDLGANPALVGTPVIVGPGGIRRDPQMRVTLPREHHLRPPLDVHALVELVHTYCRPWG